MQFNPLQYPTYNQIKQFYQKEITMMPHLLQLFNTTLEVQTNTIKYKTRETTGKAKIKSTSTQ